MKETQETFYKKILLLLIVLMIIALSIILSGCPLSNNSETDTPTNGGNNDRIPELHYSAVIKDGATIGGSVVDGLRGATGIVVSPDGKQVYVTGAFDDALAVFVFE